MKTKTIHKFIVSAIVVFLSCCFSVNASDQDLTIKFMLDSSDSMKEQDIVESSASILAAEISDFTKSSASLCKGFSTRILVDSIWQDGNEIKTQEVFDYRLGQSDAPNYGGLRDFSRHWFIDDETVLNKLVNRNWPAENKNTVLVILTNSQSMLDASEIAGINNDAKKVNSKLIITVLPRKNNYKDDALKAELAKRIHSAIEEVKSYIVSMQFGMSIDVSINGNKFDPSKKMTAEAPVRIEMNARVAGESKFFWIFKDAEKPGKRLVLTADKATDFTVTAVGIDSMGNEHKQELNYNILPVPKPVADFTVFPISGDAPLTVSISNKSVNAEKYQWSWGDGTPSSDEKEPAHTFDVPGKYTILLNVQDKNGEVASKKVEVNVSYPSSTGPKAVADFTAFPISGAAPLAISITDKSISAQKYQWNWGDGTSGTDEKEPTHTYNVPGKYTITLSVQDRNGDIASKKMEITVSYPPPIAKFIVPSGIATETTVEFTNNSQNSSSWKWTFGDDNTISSEKNAKHTFNKAGTYRVVLQAFNPDGTVSQAEESVTVNEKLVASFDWERTQTDPRTITFKNKSKGAARYKWDFGDGLTSSDVAPSHTFATQETKRFNVSLTAYSDNGQQATKTEPVRITIDPDETQPLPDDTSNVQQNVPDVPISQPQPQQSGSSFAIILVIAIVIVVGIGIAVVVIILKKGKSFTVILYSKDNKTLGQKVVKVGEVVPITSLNGGSDLDFQIVKAEDDSGDDFKVRFRKPEDSPAVLKQKTLKIHLNDQWCDPIDMSNLTVDSGRIVFSEGENEEGEE